MSGKYRGFIFDLDGTVADTKSDLSAAINHMRATYSLEMLDEPAILHYINHGVRDFIRGNMPAEFLENEELYQEAFARYQEFYGENLTKHTYIYEGVADLLETLLTHGYKVSLLSNKQDRFVKRIAKELLPQSGFTEAMGANSDFPHKPHPDSALWVAGRMGVVPPEVIFVGDSNVDMETAVNAGMYPLGVLWGYRDQSVLLASGAKTIVRTAAEILEFTEA